MQSRLLVLLCALALPMLHAKDQPTATAAGLVDAFVTAFNAGNTEALRASCDPAFWDAKHDSPQKLVRQGYAKKRNFTLKLAKLVPAEDRAVAEVMVISASTGKPADLVYLYARSVSGKWWFTGLNEEKSFREKFLAGKIEGGFHPTELPSSPDLDKLGAAVMEKLAGLPEELDVAGLEKAFAGLFTVESSRKTSLSSYQIQRFRSLKAPKKFESRWSASLGRGLVQWSEAETADNPVPEKFCAVFARTKTGWELLDVSGYPSLSAFLKD